MRPNDLIKSTGDTRTIDGVAFEFQMAPDSEAPAEMHFFVPRYKLLNLAENCTHNFHNLLPFRGAEVRDTLAWSKYLAEALQMWGGKAEAMCGQHHWPVWGTERITTMIRQQRDLYKFAHDQTVRLMNHGLNASEIAETIQLPASLEGAWHGRGYYGHIRHNVKAIYQKYLGWYDANPANLDPLPRVESGRKFVEYMGGAAAILTRAQTGLRQRRIPLRRAGPEPSHLCRTGQRCGARASRGYLRTARLSRRERHLAQRLPRRRPGASSRHAEHAGARSAAAGNAGCAADRAAMGCARRPAERPEGGGQDHGVLNWTFTDTNQTYVLILENSALTYLSGDDNRQDADASFVLTRPVLDEVIAKQTTFDAAIAAGNIKATGDWRKLTELMSLMDEFPRLFELVEPISNPTHAA